MMSTRRDRVRQGLSRVIGGIRGFELGDDRTIRAVRNTTQNPVLPPTHSLTPDGQALL
jgi:hypothetical protein